MEKCRGPLPESQKFISCLLVSAGLGGPMSKVKGPVSARESRSCINLAFLSGGRAEQSHQVVCKSGNRRSRACDA